MTKPLLVAPVGNWDMLSSALNAGTDAVYFGVKGFNMRATAQNFDTKDLNKIVQLCKKRTVKAYLTLNTIIFDSEIKKAENIVIKAKKSGIDAIICWDFSIITLCKKHKIPFHVSTQASVSNSESANFFKWLGADMIVPARECLLPQIKAIKEKSKVNIELFIHGAMCVSVSGRCFTSQFLFGKSANRGDCLQPCRREYKVFDSEEGHELVLDNNYVMSAKDLCTIDFLDEILALNPTALKIEGRAKQPEYVKVTTECYRQAIDAYYRKKLTEDLKSSLKIKLESVYNRGFSSGFYLRQPDKDDFATQYGSAASTKKLYLGKVTNYYKKNRVAEILVQNNQVHVGDKILIIGPTTGCVEARVTSVQKDNQVATDFAIAGDLVGMNISTLVRKNDKVYLVK